MYMLKSVVSVAFFAVAALAQTGTLQFTSFPSAVTAGQPVTVTWIGGDSNAPVTITLKKGLSTDLKDVGVLTSSATGGSYTWTPDTTLANGADYALFISQGASQNNYSGQFSLAGGSTAAATSATASATGTSSSAAASSTDVTGTISSAAASSTGNATRTSTTGSNTLSTLTTTRASTSATGSTVPASGASGVQSPLALLFGVVAAMLYLQ